MSGGIVNLEGLTKPATVLVEKISDAIGGLAKPCQIKRIARAEASATLLKANTDIEIDDLKRRALIRLANEEAKRQENMEAIIASSIPLLRTDAQPEKMDDDWVEHLFNNSRHVSDDAMQQHWARLLAEEANDPGRFSKHTINILASMTSREAKLFRLLSCAFIEIENENHERRATEPLTCGVYLPDDIDFRKIGLTHDDLVALEGLSVLKISSGAQFCFAFERGKASADIIYRQIAFKVRLDDQNEFDVGGIILTRWGIELAQLFDWEHSKTYLKDLRRALQPFVIKRSSKRQSSETSSS